MPWLSGPPLDSSENALAALHALERDGYPRARARTELALYLHRVRAAGTSRGETAVAGVLTVGAMAAAVTCLLILSLEVLVRRLGVGGALASFFDDRTAFIVPAIMPAALLVLLALGLAGALAALIIRYRWRRSGVLQNFVRRDSPRVDLLLWVGGSGLLVLVTGLTLLTGWWLVVLGMFEEAAQVPTFEAMILRPLISDHAQAFVLWGIPLGALGFASWFPAIHARILSSLSIVDAAFYARPIIERDLAAGAARLPESYRHGLPLRRRLWRYGLLTGGITAAAWGATQVLSWVSVFRGPMDYYWDGFWSRNSDELTSAGLASSYEPGASVGVLGLLAGLALGVGFSWFYARYLEGW